jgi:hypothetical protein
MFLDITHRPVFIKKHRPVYFSKHDGEGTSCIDWAQLSRFYLKTETESSFRKVVFWKMNRMVFLDKDRTVDNVQKRSICFNVPSPQSFSS